MHRSRRRRKKKKKAGSGAKIHVGKSWKAIKRMMDREKFGGKK